MHSLFSRLPSLGLAALLAATIWTAPEAEAHPFAATEYSLRTAFKASDQGLVAFVVLEVPIPVVMKGIGVTKEDDLATKKRKVAKYNQSIWSDMADGLTLTIDGEAVEGEWMAIEHELNGKAAEGFFVYMVGYAFADADAVAAKGRYTVSVVNTGWSNVPMWYSGSAVALEPWTVDANTAVDVLGKKSERKLTDPDRWTRDDTIRHMIVALSRAEPTP
ncbi:MAG TPA: hypothetical protein DFR83_12030 [Deltaproteobacteria bacterium]|nr:hypothetical protein [Deltaproteobacteria bacterium]